MPFDVEHLQKPFEKLIKAARASKKLEDPGRVHKLRTTTRRVEAIVRALQLPNKNQKRLLKSLQKVRKSAGRVRDMDVLTAKAADVNANEERRCQVQLLAHLGAERQRQARKLARELEKQGKGIRRELKWYAEQVAALLNGRRGLAEEEDAEAHAALRALQLSGELRKFGRLGRKNLHDFRIAGKELRYVLQMAKPQDERLLEELRKMQDAIGEWHDWEELIGIAKEVLDHARNCGLLRELQVHNDAAFEEASQMANAMWRQFRKAGEKRVVEASAKLVA